MTRRRQKRRFFFFRISNRSRDESAYPDHSNTFISFRKSLAGQQWTNSYIAVHSLNAIDALGKKAVPLKERIAALPVHDPKSPARVNQEYTAKLVKWLGTTL